AHGRAKGGQGDRDVYRGDAACGGCALGIHHAEIEEGEDGAEEIARGGGEAKGTPGQAGDAHQPILALEMDRPCRDGADRAERQKSALLLLLLGRLLLLRHCVTPSRTARPAVGSIFRDSTGWPEEVSRGKYIMRGVTLSSDATSGGRRLPQRRGQSCSRTEEGLRCSRRRTNS